MYSVHVATTNDRDLPPPELGRGLTWDRLTEVLLREVSADAASLFAEPIRDEARDQTHWHITSQDDPKPISALSDEERNKLMLRLNDRRREIGRFADKVEAEGGDPNLRLAGALRAVLSVPDERQHIWSADGKPVLTAWGRRPAKAPAAEARFIKRPPSAPLPPNDDDSSSAAIQGSSNIAYERSREAARKTAAVQGTGNIAYERGDGAPPREARDQEGSPLRGEAAAPSTLPPPPMIVAQRRFWANAALWALFVLLVAGSYYALLPACGLQLPLIGSLSDRCNFGRSAAVIAQEQRNFALRDSIAKAELEIAQKHSACATTKQRAAIEPPLDSPGPVKPRTHTKVASGPLDITLQWKGREDLDLHVYCPGGHIFFNGRSACGGTLDVDSNSSGKSAENPLEHVTWAKDPPPGNYRVEVTLFDRFNLPERQIPFKVLLRDGADEREFTGEVHKLMEMVMVTSFKR